MATPGNEWVDEAAGPAVRSHAVTGDRRRSTRERFDLVAVVASAGVADLAGRLGREHVSILEMCRRPLSVAEVASGSYLPVGVVRVLLSDLLDRALIMVRDPAPAETMFNESVLKEVTHDLRAL